MPQQFAEADVEGGGEAVEVGEADFVAGGVFEFSDALAGDAGDAGEVVLGPVEKGLGAPLVPLAGLNIREKCALTPFIRLAHSLKKQSHRSAWFCYVGVLIS